MRRPKGVRLKTGEVMQTHNLHGKNMTPADKKHAIVLALQTWPERSQRDIADQIGCSKTWVQNIRSDMVTTDHLPDRVTGKDGKSYPASYQKKPKMSVSVHGAE